MRPRLRPLLLGAIASGLFALACRPAHAPRSIVTGAAARATEPAPSRTPAETPVDAAAHAEPIAAEAAPTGPDLESADEVEAQGSACPDELGSEPIRIEEVGGPKRHFSMQGYLARALRITHGDARMHCVLVAWPPGSTNSDGKPCNIGAAIDERWLDAIENTLLRVPWHHALTVRRIVIDNRPIEHGIAAFDREDPEDARDGHTIWLHEHLFRAPNHWASGNYGAYFAYHTSEGARSFDAVSESHDLFSPVLLHEIGHLVMYNVINVGPDRISAPACAQTCADRGNCGALRPAQRESACISPYCTPFRFRGSTENWAEQYRFYYQSSTTRALLQRAGAKCFDALIRDELQAEPGVAPWERGLPDPKAFRPSLWHSCRGVPCKEW